MRWIVLIVFISLVSLSVGSTVDETVSNSTGDVNRTLVANGTVEAVNASQFLQEKNGTMENVCNITLMLEVEKEVFNISEKIVFRNRISNKSLGFLIEYWIEDIKGTVVKAPVRTANTNKKQFTPDFDAAEISLKIKNKLVWVPCNNTNAESANVKQIYVVNPDFVEEIEEVVIPTPLKVTKSSTMPKKAVVNASKEPVKAIEQKKATSASATNATKPKAKEREYTSQVRIASRGGEKIINATPTSLVEEDLVYVGSSERSRSLIPYILGGVLVIVIIGLVMREWRS